MNKTDVANFIHNIILDDVRTLKNDGRVQTRFPPEPNGYLHLGHVKSICLNFGIAEEFGGHCNLRFDDTNPEKENAEYIEAIKKDVSWLGFNWQHLRHASEYFPQLLAFAYQLIDQGDAYVDSQSAEEIRLRRGTLTQAGENSPYRARTPAENRALFSQMVAGDFPDGSHVLRAKIDMASPNINMRDPVLYRIRHTPHFHAGDSWKVYPMYDYTHCLSDMIEGITHSLCTLEFEDHRPLYDWVLQKLSTPNHPQQIEFARLNLAYTVLSKRRLIQLVQEHHVNGWDDPRMPTIAGLRRRGVPATALREFCQKIGISKADGIIEMSYFESVVRDVLNQNAQRRMVVFHPLKVTITSLPATYDTTISIANHPQNPALGVRDVPFSRTLYIEKSDFSDNPPKKWKRLSPGGCVRLRGAYVIICDEVIYDKNGVPIELKCHHDDATLNANPTGYKPSGVIHWVSANHAKNIEVRQYDKLFTVSNPAAEEDFLSTINPHSLHIIADAKAEPFINAPATTTYQFERLGYYTVDADSTAENPVFNLTISLRDTWK